MNLIRNQLQKVSIRFYRHFGTMNENDKNHKLLEKAKKIVPVLKEDMHKGQAGRIGIIGGSVEYTGAPYFAGIGALKVGADLVHVFCPKSAAIPIKSYSPELIVHPLLDDNNALDLIEPWLARLHVLVIGSGLGRDRNVLHTVSELILMCKKIQKPLVIDADGLYLLTQDISLIHDYRNVILTPNAIEFWRLFGDTNDKLQICADKAGRNITILEKAMNDRIYDTVQMQKIECPTGGSYRRCGGQGDILAGALATFYHWALESIEDDNPAVVACFAASVLTKYCNQLAFESFGRSSTATDMVEKLHAAFNELFEDETSKEK